MMNVGLVEGSTTGKVVCSFVSRCEYCVGSLTDCSFVVCDNMEILLYTFPLFNLIKPFDVYHY